MTSSTVSGNTATSSGGGLRAVGGTATVTLSTITDSTGDNLAGTIDVSGSIIADPAAGADCAGGGTFTSGGYNMVSDASCGLAGTGDQTSTDPLLGALADNGGPTLTHLPPTLGPGAGAIPAGTTGLCDGTIATDQRGTARPQGPGCDVGAVEVDESIAAIVVDDGGDGADATPGDYLCDDGTGACTLRAAVMEANALPGTQAIDITVPAVALTLTGTGDAGGDLDITDSLVIAGNGATVTQTATDERVLEATGGTLTVRSLTVTGGNLSADLDGVGLLLGTTATLERVTVTGNATPAAAAAASRSPLPAT